MIKIIGVIAISFLIIPIQIPPYALARGTTSIDLNAFSPEDLKNKILPTISGWDLEFLYRDSSAEYLAKWDAALVYYYSKQGSNGSQSIIFVLIQIMKVKHTWEASLYEWPAEHGQPTATMIGDEDIGILDNPQITGRFLEFRRIGSSDTEAVVYWYERAQFTANGTVVSRYVSISLDAYTENLAMNGLIKGPGDVDGIKTILVPMARDIADYWEPLKTWSLIHFGFGQWAGYILIGIASLFIIMTIILDLILRKDDRMQNAQIYQRLTLSHEMALPDALTLKGLSTGKAIGDKYREMTGYDIKIKSLIETLVEASEAGFIEKYIANSADNPVLVWKAKFETGKKKTIMDYVSMAKKLL